MLWEAQVTKHRLSSADYRTLELSNIGIIEHWNYRTLELQCSSIALVAATMRLIRSDVEPL